MMEPSAGRRGGGGDATAVTKLVEGTVVRALEEKERDLEEELRKWESLQGRIVGREGTGDIVAGTGGEAEEDDELAAIRQRRLEQMKRQAAKDAELRSIGHGQYEELHSIPDFFAAAKKASKMVAHFYRPSTWRCELVDKQLLQAATKYLDIRFVKINAEKAEYLCNRLSIWCIPTLVLIKDGKTEHSVVGLDELGGEAVSLEALEDVLREKKLIGPD